MSKIKSSDHSSKNNLDFSMVLASSVHDMKNSVGMLLSTIEEYVGENHKNNDLKLTTLQYEASRINTELVQLLAVYRMQGKQLSPCIEENYIGDTIDDQLARNQILLEMKNIAVECQWDPDLVWYYDPELVGGVLHNVIVNCARYSKSMIKVSAIKDNNFLVVKIADDGLGYPSEMLSNACSNNNIYTNGINFQTGSTNLGLLFAAQIARLHKQHDPKMRFEKEGRIELKNNGLLGGGEFRLYLP